MNDDIPTNETGLELPKATAMRTRVWRACLVCRKRKYNCPDDPEIKCDGQSPCAFCAAHGKDCTFSVADDHASGSRQQLGVMHERLQHVEQLLTHYMPMLQALEANTSTSVAVQPRLAAPSTSADPVASTSTSTGPSLISSESDPSYTPSASLQLILQASSALDTTEALSAQDVDGLDASAGGDDYSHYARDSIGNLRYVGGASSFVLVEALRSLRAGDQSSPASTLSGISDGISKATQNLELPFFRPGVHFKRSSLLPSPESIDYPSPAAADKLVEAYFTHIHATFPIIHQPTFLARYVAVMRSKGQGIPTSDHSFLSLLFAVFACAAALDHKPHAAAESSFRYAGSEDYSGWHYLETAQVLICIGAKATTLATIQAQSLIAVTQASWNTLAGAWQTAGAALRGAVDLGLHRSPNRLRLSPFEKNMRRRVWWCCYGLDKVLSISLGRPGGINDDDCDVELELPSEGDSSESSWIEGFLTLSQVYRVAGGIVKSAHSLSLLRKLHNPQEGRNSDELIKLVASLDASLETWVTSLNSRVKTAALSASDNPEFQTLCLLSFVVYYSAIINLHRPFIPEIRSTPLLTSELDHLSKCVHAARCCIKLGEQLERLVPTSHHLAYAVQYITISGVILLRCVGYVNDINLIEAALADAEKCCSLLRQLDRWSGAKRCSEIVSDLITHTRQRFDRSSTLAYTPQAPFIDNLRRKRPSPEESRADTPVSRRRLDTGAFEPTEEADPNLQSLESLLVQARSSGQPSHFGPESPAPATNHFDFDSFAVGDQAQQLPYGYDFLEEDLTSLLEQPFVFDSSASFGQEGGGGEAEGQGLWEALLGEETMLG